MTINCFPKAVIGNDSNTKTMLSVDEIFWGPQDQLDLKCIHKYVTYRKIKKHGLSKGNVYLFKEGVWDKMRRNKFVINISHSAF